MSVLDQSYSGIPNCFGIRVDAAEFKTGFSTEQRRDEITSENKQKMQEIDALLSEAMNTLTFEEREEQQAVLHGVEKEIAEESIFMDTALKELDSHLLRIKHGSLYEKAETMNPAYVSARAFRIMFLRGNRYDTKASADQMLKFFAQKEKLFGTEKLVKDITLNDFDEDDMAAMNTGAIQLAGRDRSNRQIVFAAPGLRIKCRHMRNELRSRYFIIMSALESEETQLKGAVNIAYAVGKYKDKSEGGGYLEHTQLALVRNLISACESNVFVPTDNLLNCRHCPCIGPRYTLFAQIFRSIYSARWPWQVR